MSAAKARNWCRARSNRSTNRHRLCCHRSRRSRRWGVVSLEANRKRFARSLSVPDQPADAQAAAPLATPAAARAPQAPTAPAKPAAAPTRPAENVTADADSELDAGTSSAFRAISPSGRPFFCNTPLSLNPDASPARAQARPAARDSDRRRRTASRGPGSRDQQCRQWHLCAGFLTAKRGRGSVCVPGPSSQVPDPAWWP